MDNESYLITLIAIIIALGLGEILAGWGRLIREKERVQIYWPHLIWTFVALLTFIQFWWGSLRYKNDIDNNLGYFLFFLINPMILFVLTVLIFPDFQSKVKIDLKEHFDKNVRLICLLSACLPSIDLIEDFWKRSDVMHEMAFGIQFAVRIVAIVLLLVGSFNRSKVYHLCLPIFLSLLVILFMLTQWAGGTS